MDTYIFVSVRSHERDHDHTLALEPDAGLVKQGAWDCQVKRIP